ncbi:MAG TPA: methylmalonyl-CoA mutase family protein [Pseudonocardia sp.]|uniref:methylmalonyl-CoA mutase family protein n=1 Tax=Pseudonocardia sp. TaxID=60912 RepID=UPI002F4217DF
MTQLSDGLVLGGEFAPPSREQWRKLVADALRKTGHDLGDAPEAVERLLDGSLGDGVDVAALYTAEDALPGAGVPGRAPFTRGATALGCTPDGWDIRQRHADPDVRTTAAAALADLRGGATSLWLVLGEGALPPDSLPIVLDEVLLDLAPIALQAGEHTGQAAEALFELAATREIAAEALSGTLGADPLGHLAGRDADYDLPAGFTELGELAARCVAERPNLRAVTVDATVYHDAGADEAQELACSLAAGVAYLRALTGAGLSIGRASGQLEFRYAASADQFATTAKLRAARSLWTRVATECGVTGAEAAQRQHAVSSERMLTARDPWVNMLRTTLACFGAGVGGADSVTALPFDTCLGLPDQFTRRIARNTQSLLVSESHLGRVIDPAGGSWYVERLTTALARQAWQLFTGIERAGGLAAALRGGSLAETLRTTWAAQEHRVATREKPITGVSEFPNLAERPPTRNAATRPAGTGLLPRVRAAAAFEALRDRADAHLAATGTRPAVFLATLGPQTSHSARTAFAANLFQAGGLATPTGGGSVEGITERFTESETVLACLCGADKTYAEQAEPVAKSLRAAGARTVLLAGSPRDEQSIDRYVYTGCDAVQALRDTLDDLGVRE